MSDPFSALRTPTECHRQGDPHGVPGPKFLRVQPSASAPGRILNPRPSQGGGKELTESIKGRLRKGRATPLPGTFLPHTRPLMSPGPRPPGSPQHTHLGRWDSGEAWTCPAQHWPRQALGSKCPECHVLLARPCTPHPARSPHLGAPPGSAPAPAPVPGALSRRYTWRSRQGAGTVNAQAGLGNWLVRGLWCQVLCKQTGSGWSEDPPPSEESSAPASC